MGISKRSAKRNTAAVAGGVQLGPPTMTIGRSAAQSIFCSSAICVRPWPNRRRLRPRRVCDFGKIGKHVLR